MKEVNGASAVLRPKRPRRWTFAIGRFFGRNSETPGVKVTSLCAYRQRRRPLRPLPTPPGGGRAA